MNIQNPYMSAARRSGDPLENKLKQEKFLSGRAAARTDLKMWRLHCADRSAGIIVEATVMEINAWNKNSRAFYAWQCELGRTCLSLMEWREVEDRSSSPVWLVKYKENGQIRERTVCANTKEEAKREFNKTASVAAKILDITEDEELYLALREQREQEGGPQC